MLAVQPDPCERTHASKRFALSALILVVREDVVDSTSVNIEARSEVLGAHRCTFNVPSGEAAAPWALPHQLRAAGFRGLPQREIARILLQRIGLCAHPLTQAFA